MSKEFRPIFSLGEEERGRKVKDVLEEKRELEERLRQAEEEAERLRSLKASLEEKLKELTEEIARRDREIEKLKEEVSRREALSRLLEDLGSSLEEKLRSVKEDLREDFLRITKEVLREFLMTDIVPKESIVTTVLEEVFNRITDIRGRVTVHLSPKDMDRVLDLLADLKSRLGDRVEIEVSSDPSLTEGEVRVETPKFIIERRHGEILEEVFREVLRNALERGKDLREGGQG
jgi:flagellar biosynthesis/type III secretory pathway protein FliH